MKKIVRMSVLALLMSCCIFSHAQSPALRIKFQPEGCEFYVYFPKQPTIKTLNMAATPEYRVDVIRAELSIPSENCFLRAEFTPVPLGSFDNINDKTLIDSAHQFARQDGWEAPAVNIENNSNGKAVNIRGYKTISGINCTFESKTYYGSESIFVVYAGGPSRFYPSSAVGRFFNSFGRSTSNRLLADKKAKGSSFLMYQDDKYLYSVWYPKTWESAPISYSQTRFKIRSENGFDDFSINVISVDAVKNMTPKDFVDALSSRDPLQLARSYLPDAVVISKGTVYLSNQEAFFVIFKGSLNTDGGRKISVKFMQWQTVKYGSVYTLTCRAETDRFQDMLPIFQKILNSFVFNVRK